MLSTRFADIAFIGSTWLSEPGGIMHFPYRFRHSLKPASWMLFLAILVTSAGTIVSAQSSEPAQTQTDAQLDDKARSVRNEVIINGIFDQEAKLVQNMHKYTPLVETYIQNMKNDATLGSVPERDQYFLGRLVLDQKGAAGKLFQNKQSNANFVNRLVERLDTVYRVNYSPLGFMQLVFLNNNFDNQHYELRYVRKQFLGQVRTFVFDVVPRKK